MQIDPRPSIDAWSEDRIRARGSLVEPPPTGGPTGSDRTARAAAAPIAGLVRTSTMAALLAVGAADARAQDGWLEQESATGGWGGARQRIVDAGITPAASYTTDLLGNPVGGGEAGLRICGRSRGLARVRSGEAARP